MGRQGIYYLWLAQYTTVKHKVYDTVNKNCKR